MDSMTISSNGISFNEEEEEVNEEYDGNIDNIFPNFEDLVIEKLSLEKQLKENHFLEEYDQIIMIERRTDIRCLLHV